MIRGDSILGDYKLLRKWTKGFDCKGFKTCEIGVREGLASVIIMDNVINNYIHIGVDPYDNLKYQHYDNDKNSYQCDYTNKMRDQLIKDMDRYIRIGRFALVNETDTSFMNGSAHQASRYSFVHFDGPHMTKDVMTECIWFANRAAPITRFVFDDFPKYNMQLIRDVLKLYGFEIMDQGQNKICLEKNAL